MCLIKNKSMNTSKLEKTILEIGKLISKEDLIKFIESLDPESLKCSSREKYLFLKKYIGASEALKMEEDIANEETGLARNFLESEDREELKHCFIKLKKPFY